MAIKGNQLFVTGLAGLTCVDSCDYLVPAYDLRTDALLWEDQYDSGGDDNSGPLTVGGNRILVSGFSQVATRTASTAA